MTEVLHKLEIDLEDSEPERKAQQDQAAVENSEPREVQLDQIEPLRFNDEESKVDAVDETEYYE